MSRHYTAASATTPQTQLMGHGDWTTLLTNRGSGFTQWRGLAIGRWREDPVADDCGSYLLLRDAQTGKLWSATQQPCGHAPGNLAVVFGTDGARYTRDEGGVHSTLDVWPNPEGDGEWRQITLHNTGNTERLIDVFSCTELALGPAAADAVHPAFAKMFVQTAAHDEGKILLAWRRKSAPDEPDICAAHGCLTSDAAVQNMGFETDRMRFMGRGRHLCNALALTREAPSAGRAGTVLDPLFALQRRVRLAPGKRVCLSFFTLAGAAREAVLQRARACLSGPTPAAPTGSSASPQMVHWQRLSTPLFYSDPAWRGSTQDLQRARGGQPSLWAHGVSGDRPIVLVHVQQCAHLALVHELLAVQRWWRDLHVPVDVVALSTDDPVETSGSDEVFTALKQLQTPDNQNGFFVLHAKDLTAQDRTGLAAVARVVLDASHGDLAAQIRHIESLRQAAPTPALPAHGTAPQTSTNATATVEAPATPTTDRLEYFNGVGGFDAERGEYVIHLPGEARTPMPWINVIANEHFGFTTSAEGGGYAWAVNSQKNAITPWSNDPVRDAAGDLIYIRDTDSDQLWTATPDPIRAAPFYEIHHGQGYTRFAHTAHGIHCELLQLLPLGETTKVSRLQLHNTSEQTRHLALTAYVRWALGGVGETTAPHIVTEHDDTTGALLARNDWRADYMGRVAFAHWCDEPTQWTCDRQEFLGTMGSTAKPAALLGNTPLTGRCGAGLDPCAALQTTLALAPGETRELVFLLGEAASVTEARAQIERLRNADGAQQLQAVRAHWQHIFDAVQIQTPNRHMDLMVNRWLPYQIISCRLDARTAFYQASGAWGFRDQLQDVGALTLNAPERVREQLLRAASRQFPEGDVQHWWLPPTGAGVRTHIVDDRLWLPLIAAHYVQVTGDAAVLDENIAFLQGKPLPADRIDDFYAPPTSDESASVYEHCARAIDVSLPVGPHGLPLFGTGDWNDGMNRVGVQGRGESVWMAWFLHASIAALAPLAEARGEHARAQTWREHAASLRHALHTNAWDGQWWLRGWFDDGTPLGSANNAECRIDGIAQAWSVLSGACDKEQAQQVMDAVDHMLVDRDTRVVALLTPPFDHNGPDPGYIRGYPPGLRENGGQYTHGCVWSAMAFAQLGEGDRACELWDMLAPISHSHNADTLARWQVEPYVACADVYTAPEHLGRGGWTWYSGTAGWLYRAALESILGLHVRGQSLQLAPCIARDWPEFSITLRWRSARYHIHVANPAHVCSGIQSLHIDGIEHPVDTPIPLQDDGGEHRVELTLGHHQPA